MVEKWWDVVYSLEAESAVLTDDVDVKCQRSTRRGKVDESETWTLLSICWGIGEGRNACGEAEARLSGQEQARSPRDDSSRALPRVPCSARTKPPR